MMRRRALFALAASSFVIALVLLRHDLRELADLTQTYATFHTHLDRHPELLYRFPSSKAATARLSEDELVPPIFHRIVLGKDQKRLKTKYEDAVSSCQNLHPNWTHHVWTDDDAMEFLAGYHPHGLRAYKELRRKGQGAELLSYALLEHYGGVYLDLGIECLQPLDDLRRLPFLTAGARPVGVDNGFIMSRPHHSFLRQLLHSMEIRGLRWRLSYVENLFLTGSTYFSTSWMRYSRYLAGRTEGEISADEQVHILADKHGFLDAHMLGDDATTPLFRRAGGKAGPKSDDDAMDVIGRHWIYFLATMAFGAVAASIWLWRASKRRTTEQPTLDESLKREKVEKIQRGPLAARIGRDEKRDWKEKLDV